MNTEQTLDRADAQARQAALDVSRSFIVQAPAGSGKTELLIQRYLRLLTTVEHPEEILAITFTRKAAAEMQLRILQALQRAAAGNVPAEAHEKSTFDAARQVLQNDRKYNWQLVDNPRRLRIQTIDSLNAAIVRMVPLSVAGGGSGSRVVADTEMQSLYAEAAVLTFDQLLEVGAGHDATRLVLAHLDNNTRLYVDYLARMLATRDQWLPFVGSGLLGAVESERLRGHLESSLQRAVTERLQKLVASLPAPLGASLFELCATAAGVLLNSGQSEHPGCALADMIEMPPVTPQAVPCWQGLAELLLTKQGALRKTVTKAQGFPAGTPARDAMLEQLELLAEEPEFNERLHATRDLPPVRYTDEQWAVLLALFRLLPIGVTELKRLFSSRGVSDFIEVALGAADALGSAEQPGDVALLFDYQLRHLLVDEMQDTSSAQYRMLEALTGGWQPDDGRTLFCVGDPMQSIYRFRNAEVGQFLLARETGIGSVDLEPLTLRRNFRSGERLVNWFNETFPGLLPLRNDAAESAVSYSAAVPVHAQRGQGHLRVHPIFGSDAEPDAGCGVIAELLSQDEESDVAVLVRSRTILPELLSRLRAAKIPYRAVDIDRLTDLPEIIDVLALTRALVHRGDRLAWLALLRSPWVGLDWSDLHGLVVGAPQATVWELMTDDDRLAALSESGRDRVVQFCEQLTTNSGRGLDETLRGRVERLWLVLGGPGILDSSHQVDNVYHFLDVLEGIESAGTLADVAELENLLDRERVSNSGNARLQVMTMHRAKGLQFDHVVLYGLGRTSKRSERSLLSWFDRPTGHGSDEKIISPVGARAEVDSDPLHRFIERTEILKDQHETGRLLYVACTRARRSLHLLGHVAPTADAAGYRPPRADSLLSRLWPAVRSEYENAFRKARVSLPTRGGSDIWARPALRRLDRSWTLPEPASLPALPHAIAHSRAGREVHYDWVGTEARLAGTIVHRWLQLAGGQRIDLESISEEQLVTTSRRWVLEAGADAAHVASITERVVLALRQMTSHDKGRWLLSGPGHAELALTGLHAGRIESVVLDRVRIDAGTHWIVDYKTSTHEGSDLAAFLDAEAKRYLPQLQKYARLYGAYANAPVRCALYFPLLQEFVEVAIQGGD